MDFSKFAKSKFWKITSHPVVATLLVMCIVAIGAIIKLDWLLFFLTLKLAVWHLLVTLAIIIILAYFYNAKRKKREVLEEVVEEVPKDIPKYLSYTKAVFEEVLQSVQWRWKWKFDKNYKRYIRIELTPHCKECGSRLVTGFAIGSHASSNYLCPRHNKGFRINKVDFDKAQSIIDNIIEEGEY